MLGSLRRAIQRYLAEVKHATTPRGYSFFQELVLFDFIEEGATDKWDCISDSDVGGGSHSTLQLNGKGTGAVFSGYLDPSPPLDQSTRYSGYCAIRSKPKKVGWFENPHFDVSEYDDFELRVRGDGRRYIVNLGYPNMARKDDVWQCFLFTKGGPDWEDIRLPFKEFFVTHRGYMQDTEFSFPRSTVTTIGILLADRVQGPFQLEIQYIKAVRKLATGFQPVKVEL